VSFNKQQLKERRRAARHRRAARRRRKAGRIVIGIAIMVVLVAIPIVILSRFAGGWGVPFFSFTTDRGGKCTNTLTGYKCNRLTVADISWWGDIKLPQHTKIIRAHYESDQAFELNAVVVVPKTAAKSTYKKLHKTFGSCGRKRPGNVDTSKLNHGCTIANQETDPRRRHGPVADRNYVINTGLRHDGKRVIGIKEKSR
jgi:hypothetical protein